MLWNLQIAYFDQLLDPRTLKIVQICILNLKKSYYIKKIPRASCTFGVMKVLVRKANLSLKKFLEIVSVLSKAYGNSEGLSNNLLLFSFCQLWWLRKPGKTAVVLV